MTLIRPQPFAAVTIPDHKELDAGTLRGIIRGAGLSVLEPQARFYSDPPTETSESAIKTVPSGQLYTVLGKSVGDGRWQLRLWWKPLVTLIWLGGALIALGGALSLVGRALRARRKGSLA